MPEMIILRWALAQHGGQRRGAGRPIGSKTLRPSAALIEAARVDENLIPVKFEGDSLEFLRETMTGKIWPTREQIYAAKSVLPIEHPAGGYCRRAQHRKDRSGGGSRIPGGVRG
jgi:hypothetical protein